MIILRRFYSTDFGLLGNRNIGTCLYVIVFEIEHNFLNFLKLLVTDTFHEKHSVTSRRKNQDASMFKKASFLLQNFLQ